VKSRFGINLELEWRVIWCCREGF